MQRHHAWRVLQPKWLIIKGYWHVESCHVQCATFCNVQYVLRDGTMEWIGGVKLYSGWAISEACCNERRGAWNPAVREGKRSVGLQRCEIAMLFALLVSPRCSQVTVLKVVPVPSSVGRAVVTVTTGVLKEILYSSAGNDKWTLCGNYLPNATNGWKGGWIDEPIGVQADTKRSYGNRM